ncbi:MAG: WbqC family protein [Gallionella sp.]
MKLAIMQPYFFPYIGYWQLIYAADRFVIYDDVNYIKGGWINRNRVLINGEPAYITVPLYQQSSFKRICDIALQPSPIWRDKLVKSVETTYRKAPCFGDVFPVIEEVIRHEADNLSDYLVHQLQTLSAFMQIHTEFVLTSRHYGNNDLSGQERIIDICKREGANTYINPQGGQALYDRVTFTRWGLDLKFLIPSAIEYKQFGSLHVPWLSIIDVMMFNSKSQIRTLLNKYELVNHG